jgi:indole-3-glycerol phosphate synthase
LKEEEYAKLYKIDVDEFKIFDSDFEKLKIKKNHKEVAEWYIEFRKDITNFLKEISKAQSLEIIEEIKKTSKEDGALSLVDFS